MSLKEGNKEGSDLSQFVFLSQEWPAVFEPAAKAESLVYPDSRSSCFHARRALELAVHWLYKHDSTLRLPYQDHLSALVHEPTFRRAVGPAVFAKIKVIKDLGNLAVHSHKPVRQLDALTATKELFHFMFWLARTYARGAKPADNLSFNPDLLPKSGAVPAQTLEQLQKLESQLRERDEKLSELLSGKKALDDELERLRERSRRGEEAERGAARHSRLLRSRDARLLHRPAPERSWVGARPTRGTASFPLPECRTRQGRLCRLRAVGRRRKTARARRSKEDEARRTGRPAAGEAVCGLPGEKFGQRPIIFYSNGYQHWMWDDVSHPPRAVQGFYKKTELELLIQRRTTRKNLADAKISKTIVERYYQTRAIRRVSEAFERDNSPQGAPGHGDGRG